MRYLVSGKEMKAIDMRSIHEYGIPSLVLMERAALEVAKAAEELLMGAGMGAWAKDGQKKCLAGNRVWAVCGLGNNGADGVAVARMLHLHGALVSVLLPGMDLKMSGEMEIQLDIAKKLEIPK